MADNEEWVVWNGVMGILVMAALGRVEDGEDGRIAWLAPPYDVVGPFSLDELLSEGRIAYGEALVMSRLRWREDQAELRREAFEKRRAQEQRFSRLFDPRAAADDSRHREALGLRREGALQAAEINAAFRRLAKTAHPDAGGSNELYRRISEARDALLERVS